MRSLWFRRERGTPHVVPYGKGDGRSGPVSQGVGVGVGVGLGGVYLTTTFTGGEETVPRSSTETT